MTGSLAVATSSTPPGRAARETPRGGWSDPSDRGRSWQLVEGDGIDDLRILGFVPTSEDRRRWPSAHAASSAR